MLLLHHEVNSRQALVGAGRADIAGAHDIGWERVRTTLNDTDSSSSLEQIDEDEFLSSVAVIVCVVLLLVVVVALALFTRLGGV